MVNFGFGVSKRVFFMDHTMVAPKFVIGDLSKEAKLGVEIFGLRGLTLL
jgi:hypothetical protein